MKDLDELDEEKRTDQPEEKPQTQSTYYTGGDRYVYDSRLYSESTAFTPESDPDAYRQSWQGRPDNYQSNFQQAQNGPYYQQGPSYQGPQYGSGQGYGYQHQPFGGYNQNYQRTPMPDHPNYSYTKPAEKTRYIGFKGVLAIILSCALIFSSIGFGSAWLLSRRMQATSQQQSGSQLPDQFAQRPDQAPDAQQIPGGDQQENAESGSSLADSADSARKADLNILTASTEDGALTTPEIVQKTQDSVVEIVTELVVTGSYMRQYTTSGAGSGVIITEDGYILTNNHVIEDAKSITVTLHNGEAYPAQLLGLDEQLDVALLKIDATGLTPATVASSSDLMVGQTVIAIGNPLGQLGGSVTQGIISALDRSITIDNQTMTLLQIDAAINPGNSGGGLFNAQGNLIGLVNAKSTGSDIDGIGFAIPIDNIMEVVDDLKTHGYVTGRVAVGISLLDIGSEQEAWMYRVNYLGCYVYRVTDGSPAAKGGLQSGDRILSINGTEVSTSAEVKNAIQSVHIGDALTFVVERNGQEITLTVIAGEYVPEGISTSSDTQESGQAAN